MFGASDRGCFAKKRGSPRWLVPTGSRVRAISTWAPSKPFQPEPVWPVQKRTKLGDDFLQANDAHGRVLAQVGDGAWKMGPRALKTLGCLLKAPQARLHSNGYLRELHGGRHQRFGIGPSVGLLTHCCKTRTGIAAEKARGLDAAKGPPPPTESLLMGGATATGWRSFQLGRWCYSYSRGRS